MKYWKQVCVISGVIALVAAGCLSLIFYQEHGRTHTKEEKKQEADPKMQQENLDFSADMQEELYKQLYAFAQVLYQYDTAERKFYEGAEEYMTPEAYRKLCPVSAPEEDAQGIVRVRSTLREANIYAFYSSETEADVILESRFSLTQGTNGSLTQYLRLTLEKQEGQWLITEYKVIDTLEE